MLQIKSCFYILIILFFSVNIYCSINNNSKKQLKKLIKTEIKKSSKTEKITVTFVELGSVNCIPCKLMKQVMMEIEKEYGDKGVKIVFYDVWTKEGQPYGEKYKIRAIPTQVFLDKDGKEYFRHEGFFPKDELVEVLKKGGIK